MSEDWIKKKMSAIAFYFYQSEGCPLDIFLEYTKDLKTIGDCYTFILAATKLGYIKQE